jgi:hypothetical protein
VFPQAQELWAVFLCGGLFGLLLYRLWTMLLTSLIGTLFACHAGLLLGEQFFSFDAVGLVEQNVPLFNGVVVGLVVLGVLLQSASAPDEDGTPEPDAKREKKEKGEKKKEKKESHSEAAHAHGHDHDHPPPAPKASATPWWRKLLPSRKTA